MNLIKRIYLSIVRRPAKSIVLFVIVFVLGNLLCASIAISNSAGQLKNNFISQLGFKGEVILNEKREIDSNLTYNNYEQETKDLLGKFNNYMNSEGYKKVLKYGDLNYVVNHLKCEELSFQNDSDLSILAYGVGDRNLIDVQEMIMHLSEGRTFSEEEMLEGRNVILISDTFQYADGSKIKVNDKITFKRTSYDVMDANQNVLSEDVEYEVIGIFNKVNPYDGEDYYDYNNLNARIYMPNQTIVHENEWLENINDLYDVHNYPSIMRLYKVALRFNRPDFDEAFKEDFSTRMVNGKKRSYDYFQSKSSGDVYKKVAAPIESISIIAKIITVISEIAVFAILSLVSTLFIRDRKYEIGVMISMGDKKPVILAQILSEVVIIAMLAVSISMFTGNKIGQAYVNQLNQNQAESSQYIVEEDISQKEVLENFKVEIDKEYVQMVYASSLGVILFSTIVPVVYILRLNPRKLLM